MTLALRFAGTYSPPNAAALRLRFGALFEGGGGGGTTPPVVTRHLAALTVSTWSAAKSINSDNAASWRPSTSALAVVNLTWGATDARGTHVAVVWGALRTSVGTTLAPWRSTAPLGLSVGTMWRPTSPRSCSVAALWQPGSIERVACTAPWQPASPQRAAVFARWQGAAQQRLSVRARANGAQPMLVASAVPWGPGLAAVSLGGPWVPGAVVPPTVIPCYTPPAGNVVVLRFTRELLPLTRLLFACAHALATVRVPIREVYMVTNTTTLTRVADGQSIATLGMSLSLDVDSWAWGFNATLPADQLGLIEPASPGEPIELEAVVNGTAVRVLVESISRERSFGQASISIQGRSKLAALDAPYYPLGTFHNAAGDVTSQQLLDAALPFGWTADWSLTAWLVPAGVWSHQGTPITAALAIAAAGGGYLQPHGTANVLRVLPRYPLAPWDWAAATPDLELPAAVTVKEGIDWVEKARYNRVFVSGVNAGVLGQVTRAGTAGDVEAPMVTDALITHVDAVRQRGLPVLADTGRRANVRLRLPVLAATGVILPGKLIRYVDGATARVGLSRAVAVEVGRPEVWQTITVETHA